MKKLSTKFQTVTIVLWSIVIALLACICGLIQVPEVWCVGVLFMIVNVIISYHVGTLVKSNRLSRLWLFILPLIFCLAVLFEYAPYNYLFGLVYLIFELFGFMSNEMYH